MFDLSSQEQQQLSTHLGHTMDIHKIHYRQMSGLIKKIDISKIMLIQEYNLMAKYAGKKLNDITLEGKVHVFLEKNCLIKHLVLQMAVFNH